MIVGGLLASGLALGAGTASAATTCKIGDDSYEIVDSVLYDVSGGQCTTLGAPIPAFLSSMAGGLKKVVSDTASTGSDAAGGGSAGGTSSTGGTGSPGGSTGTGGTTTGGSTSDAGGTGTGTGSKGSTATTSAAPKTQAQQPAPFVPPPAPLGAIAPAGAAAAPFAAFSPAALGGIAPAGLASNLFAANAYDPGLLFGSPLGGAAAQLFNPQAGSGVTTVSQAQVLSAPGRGYGTPATIGVIILACLIGFAVRHRVISRMKARDVPEDTTPRHAAPEVEQIDDESDARTTVLTR